MTFIATGTIGDPVCPCGCGSWLGQCARAWNEQTARILIGPRHYERFPSPFEIETTAPTPLTPIVTVTTATIDPCPVPACRICGGPK